MSFDLDSIRAEVARTQRARDLAWVDTPWPLYSDESGNGPLVYHLTLQKQLWLRWCESPFVVGGDTEPDADVAMLNFLWIISPECTRYDDKDAHNAWLKETVIDLERCKLWICDYLDLQYRCSLNWQYRAPRQPKQGKDPSFAAQFFAIIEPLKQGHFVSYYQRLMYRFWGWEPTRTMQAPLPQLHLMEIDLINENGGEAKPEAADTFKAAYLDWVESQAEQKEDKYVD